MSEATRRAELALFAGSGEAQGKSAANEPAGRILPSLIEPLAPEAPVEEDAQPRRRGRKPGSKNKPKPSVVALAEPAPTERYAPTLEAQPRVDGAVAVMPEALTETPTPDTRHDVSGREPRTRQRLRDRSRILARYVHGTQPPPGERWMSKGRRARRGSPA